MFIFFKYKMDGYIRYFPHIYVFLSFRIMKVPATELISVTVKGSPGLTSLRVTKVAKV